jgi:hypothetical protein
VPNYHQADPKAVFTKAQWAAIAKSIHRTDIPREDKQEICDALFEYAIASIEPEELERFPAAIREFRAAASRVQGFIKDLRWNDKIEDLCEEIWQLQKYIQVVFKLREKPKGGRPTLDARDNLVDRLGVVYERNTGRVPGRSENPETGKLTGPFARFLGPIFEYRGISLSGLKHAIAKASRNAKNRPNNSG